jgi:hypothetical protein
MVLAESRCPWNYARLFSRKGSRIFALFGGMVSLVTLLALPIRSRSAIHWRLIGVCWRNSRASSTLPGAARPALLGTSIPLTACSPARSMRTAKAPRTRTRPAGAFAAAPGPAASPRLTKPTPPARCSRQRTATAPLRTSPTNSTASAARRTS